MNEQDRIMSEWRRASGILGRKRTDQIANQIFSEHLETLKKAWGEEENLGKKETKHQELVSEIIRQLDAVESKYGHGNRDKIKDQLMVRLHTLD